MNVLSLFDGISCARTALHRTGIKVEKYYSSEIDKWTSAITRYNYPDTIELGDVRNWKNWDIDFSSIDLLIAGFPCQSWSVAGKQGGDTDPRGQLMWEMLDILNHIRIFKPDVKFLFENVEPKKEFKEYIDKAIGVDSILINSALVSAQSRKRNYWTNIEGVTIPSDKGILVKDIIELVVDTKYYLSGKHLEWFNKNKEYQLRKKYCALHTLNSKDKAITMTARQFASWNGNHLIDDIGVRMFTPIECECLQTLPDNYTKYGIDTNGTQIEISNTQRYKSLGNSFTCDVIAHILSFINKI